MSTELEFEHRSQIADAKLGVAEDLGWLVAILFAVVVHQKWESWLFTIMAAIVSYISAIYKYRKDSLKAEDEYYQIANLGKYAKQHGGDI